MLNTWISLTTGTLRWLLIGLLEFIEPFLKAILFVMIMAGIIGLIWFSAALISDPNQIHDPKIKVFIILMITGFIGGIANVYYEIVYSRLYLAMAIGEERVEEETPSLLAKMMNWSGLLGIFALLCWGSFHYYHLANELEATFIGSCWFVAIGMILGAFRWIYRKLQNQAHGIIRPKMSERDAMRSDMAKKAVVVPFRRPARNGQ